MSIYEKIPSNRRAPFLEALLEHYIERQGLGAMPKADFDALIVHTFLEHSNEPFDSFALSELFKIKESRLKSLLETAAVKFEEREMNDIWMEIIRQWKDTLTEVNRIESGEIRFKLENPAYFRYVQREVRATGSTISYNPTSEAIVLPLGIMFKVLDRVHEYILKEQTGHRAQIEDLLVKIKKDLIGENELAKLKGEKKSKLKEILDAAKTLTSIGGLVAKVFF